MQIKSMHLCSLLGRYLVVPGTVALFLCTSCSTSSLVFPGNLAANDARSQIDSGSSIPVQSNTEDAQPHIQDIRAIGITSSGATIAWSSTKPLAGRVQWGETANYQFSAAADAALQQAVTLTGLKPDTNYSYRVTLINQNGESLAGPDLTFRTLEQLNVRSLRISNVHLSRMNLTSATISWTTDVPAIGRVEYGQTLQYDSSSPIDSNYRVDHSKDVTSLSAGITYHYRVVSLDRNGNEAVSQDQQFIAGAADRAAPLISDITVTNVTHASATINWTTDEYARCQVEYDSNLSYRKNTPPDEGREHTVILDNLDNNTAYHFIIRATDFSGNMSTSQDRIFVTSMPPRSLINDSLLRSRCGCRDN